MSLLEAGALLLAALLGGALNAVAGGASFVTFPVLVFAGIDPIAANATSTAALWPGTVASAAAYRRELRARPRLLLLLGGVSLLGGVLGATLLLRTPQATFTRLVPFLLLLATLLFAFGGAIAARLRARLGKRAGPAWLAAAGVALLQLAIAVYGGYFGGGIGVLMLAALALLGLDQIHAMNAFKTLLASCINGVAVATFVAAGAVRWPQALVMVAGAIAGGYGGAALARRLDPAPVRRFIILVGCAMTLYFFLAR